MLFLYSYAPSIFSPRLFQDKLSATKFPSFDPVRDYGWASPPTRKATDGQACAGDLSFVAFLFVRSPAYQQGGLAKEKAKFKNRLDTIFHHPPCFPCLKIATEPKSKVMSSSKTNPILILYVNVKFFFPTFLFFHFYFFYFHKMN